MHVLNSCYLNTIFVMAISKIHVNLGSVTKSATLESALRLCIKAGPYQAVFERGGGGHCERQHRAVPPLRVVQRNRLFWVVWAPVSKSINDEYICDAQLSKSNINPSIKAYG